MDGWPGTSQNFSQLDIQATKLSLLYHYVTTMTTTIMVGLELMFNAGVCPVPYIQHKLPC